MGLGGVISNLLSLSAKLLPAVNASGVQAPSSSSSPPVEGHQIEAEMKKLMRMLERIKATLYDAEQREIRDMSVKLWLKELKEVAYDAEDVLDEYHYEVLHAQAEAKDACPPDSRKRKLIQVPDGMLDQIKQIRSKFDEIEKYRIALRLFEEDGLRCSLSELEIAPTGHFINASGVFGREREKEKLIDLLSSDSHDDKVFSVVTIVGTGGLGKTTLAQLVYNDKRIRQTFDKFGWVSVSDDFNVQRLTRESLESITGSKCTFINLSALQEEISTEIRGKKILLVFDDVWNEKRSLWELFQAPFVSAKFAKILVTTRNENVARIMQTEPTFFLGYPSKEQCWKLFKHYAWGDINYNETSNFVKIGKNILEKCGMLPLAVKSIASLLRYEVEEMSWVEILESELWESDACNEIYQPLQLSYTRLPTYLKPCFLYCSMFSKDFTFYGYDMVKLWISQGYIESKGRKSREIIGKECLEQLWQRSFFEIVNKIGPAPCDYEFKLHDMVHDLARFNSENGCYSLEANEVLTFPKELYHLYVHDFAEITEPPTSCELTNLRSFIMPNGAENFVSTLDLSKAPNLRAVVLGVGLGFDRNELDIISSIGTLKHLRHLSLARLTIQRVPDCIGSLYNLQILKFMDCDFNELPRRIGNLISLEELVIQGNAELRVLPDSVCQLKALRNLYLSECNLLEKLPTNIGNLISLEKLVILRCDSLKQLPESLGQLKTLRELILHDCNVLKELPSDMGSLTNLQTLEIHNCRVSSLPPSLGQIIGTQTLSVTLECDTIGWLKDFQDLGGTLHLVELANMSSLTNAQCANLVSMHNLEGMMLWWNELDEQMEGNGLMLRIKRDQNIFLEDQNDFEVMASLQPHPNLRELAMECYGGAAFPEWIRNPSSCASLEKIVLSNCSNLTFLPFGSLPTLKYLVIAWCHGLQFLRAESLPLELRELKILQCRELVSLPGIQNLQSLIKLRICSCANLHSLVMDAEHSVELMLHTNESSYQKSVLGLRNLTSLRSLRIGCCPKLQVLANDLLPLGSSTIKVWDCPLLRDWCTQHSIKYTEHDVTEDEEEKYLDTEDEMEF